MLLLNLDPLFKARGIDKPFTFLTKNGFTSHTTHRLLNSKSRHFHFDHIEQLCRIFLCEPNDLLLWVPDADTLYPENLPLLKLTKNESANDWRTTFAAMPFQELQKLTLPQLRPGNNNSSS